MKKALFISFLFLQFSVFSQTLFFPPELLWWQTEITKYDPTFRISQFQKDEEQTITVNKDNKKITYLYPVLSRYNYSGNLVSHILYGIYLTKRSDGRYSIDQQREYSFLITKPDHTVILYEPGSYFEHINAAYWLSDSKLIAVGYEIYGVDRTISGVAFFIKEYLIENSKIQIIKYRTDYELNTEEKEQRFKSLHLEWIEQRADYFIN